MKLLKLVAATILFAAQVTTSVSHAQEVKVGFALPFTGHYAFLGVQAKKGVELGMEEYNKSHANSKVKMVPVLQDQTGDKTKVTALMSQFAVREKVDLILGPIGTAEALAAAPIVNELKVPTYTTAVSTDVLKAGPWSFKMWQDPGLLMNRVADQIIKSGVKTIVVTYMKDGDSYITFKNLAVARLKAGGVTVLSEEPQVSGDADFSALGTKLANLKPDALFLGGLPEISANVVVQAKRLGLPATTKLFGIGTLSTPSFARIGGKDVEGTIIPTDYFHGTPGPVNAAFVNAYRAKHKEDPDLFAALGYQYTLIAAHAIDNAGPNPTRESIRAALANIKELPSVLGAGRYTLDEERVPSYGVTLVQYQSGKLVALGGTL